MLEVFRSRKTTIALLLALLPLIIVESRERGVPGYIFIGFAVPLVLNLVLCLFDHIRKSGKFTLKRIGFITFHASFLVIITGGIITYYTYTVGYIELAEGQGFRDYKGNYTAWQQKFDTKKDTGIYIVIRKIMLEFWENGQIKEFRNEVLIKDGDRGKNETLNVNGSLKYGDLLINMSRFYGLAPYFTLITPHGNTSGYVNIKNEMKFNSFEIPMAGYRAHVSYKDINDKQINIKIFLDGKTLEREMKKGDTIDLGKSSLELTDIRIWNGLTVVTDSGKQITYTGFVLFLAGLALYYGSKFSGSQGK